MALHLASHCEETLLCLNQAIHRASLSAAILLVVTASPKIHLPYNPICAIFFHSQRAQTANEFNVGAVTFGSLVEIANHCCL